jgi:flavin-dependent dehydrogenase
MLKDEQQFDIVIAGAGPAGSSAAIHLARSGARVALVEQKSFPRPKLCGEFISPECLTHFERLGVLESMLAGGATTLDKTVFYSRRGRNCEVPSIWFGGMALGLSRAEMDNRLLERARECGATIFTETSVTGLIQQEEKVAGVAVRNGTGNFELRAPLVIDATGRARQLARYIQKQRHEQKHRDEQKQREVPLQRERSRPQFVAFKAHLENTTVEAGSCEIYFYTGGYGGLSSVENGRSNLCFIVSSPDVRDLGSDVEALLKKLVMSNARAAETLKSARPASEWLSVALNGFGRQNPVPAPGLVAIGDAASFIDPFTGSGMLMALESGALVGKIVAAHLGSLVNEATINAISTSYSDAYNRRFDSRLRICSMLRRAAFFPRLAEATIVASRISSSLRRRLAIATRQPDSTNFGPKLEHRY